MHWGEAEVRVAGDGTSVRLMRGPDLVLELAPDAPVPLYVRDVVLRRVASR